MNPAEMNILTLMSLYIDNPESDYFTLFGFSAKYDPVPTANSMHGYCA
ncbi:MAG: hypothetical protein ACE364_08930 [Chlorobiota bacterium]